MRPFFNRGPPTPRRPGRTGVEALRHAIEPVPRFTYWSEPAYEAYAALGLDFLSGYVWSILRARRAGESVVAAAFGAFDPAAVAGLYAAEAACGLADIREARERGARKALGHP